MHTSPQGFGNGSGRLLFVDNIRFWCMVAVVGGHCTNLNSAFGHATSLLTIAAATLCKFGTIGFFLVSGFLLERDLGSRSSAGILGKRLQKVILPWLSWFALSFALFTAHDALRHKNGLFSGASFTAVLRAELERTLLGTALWFVPNLVLCLLVVLLLRRFVYSPVFGLLLLTANLVYVLNIYAQWTSPLHTRALFGFVFYLWAGVFLAHHRSGFERFIARVDRQLVWLAVAVTAAAAFAEARYLSAHHSADPLNTLRLSNQLFSLAVVLALCTLRRPAWPSFVDVPRHSFGIYLSHPILLGLAMMLLRWLFALPHAAALLDPAPSRAMAWVVCSFVTWCGGFAVTRIFANSASFSFLVGLAATEVPGVNPQPAYKPLPARV